MTLDKRDYRLSMRIHETQCADTEQQDGSKTFEDVEMERRMEWNLQYSNSYTSFAVWVFVAYYKKLKTELISFLGKFLQI